MPEIALAPTVPSSGTRSSVDTLESGPALPSTVVPGPASAPVTVDAERPSQPEAVQPQTPARRKLPKIAPGEPTRTPQHGDLICGACGEANADSRKFCSRCGTTLTTAAVIRIAWWKRFAPRRKRSGRRAGERPWQAKGAAGPRKPKTRRLAKAFMLARRSIAVALMVGGLLYGFYTPFRHRVDDTYGSAKAKVLRVIHPQFDPVSPGPGTSSNQAAIDPDHPAILAVDGFKNTYWIASPPTADSRPELDVTLTERTDLARLIIRNGASDNFQGFHRPRTLMFIFDNGAQDELQLKNTPDPQTLTVHHGGGVTRFRIVVTDVYQSIDGSSMALTEIELFKKR